MGKWFATLYDIFMAPFEQIGVEEIRKQLIGKATGSVLEIGTGTGLNFPYYQHAKKVDALEPNPNMRNKSYKRAKSAKYPITVLEGSAEILSFPDNTFDSIVGTLVFCTIPNPELALKEMRRVCKPDGQILLFEHVRSHHAVLGRVQDRLTPLWKRLCDGCHLNRDTLGLVKREGWKVTRTQRYFKNIFVVIEAVNKK
ncbi:methyltransferase type 11 [Brevibacillus choshinensis]|uniref:Methyltransferase type 11 n=1 Tax=Brevibacillus choshinensis TaxID=54911 RepID=A0ABR5NEJ7_BRECH|nr:class I SAM-dependent methyltransferase [Brevibacillus choshinensis]KQL49826.1 methyltransferase type 11 [Brevibacillus choshinensis]